MTIAGQHTLQEAIVLLETKNAQILATDKGYTSQKAAIDAKDPALDLDWPKFLSRWRSFFVQERIKMAAASTISGVTPNFLLPAEPLYQNVLDELAKAPRFSDFIDRFAKAGATFAVNVGQMKDIDVDLETYKKADQGIKAGEKAVKDNTPLIIASIIGTGAWLWWTRSKR